MRKALLLAAVLAAGALFALERVDLNGLWDFRFERNKSLEDVAREHPRPPRGDREVLPRQVRGRPADHRERDGREGRLRRARPARNQMRRVGIWFQSKIGSWNCLMAV